MWVLTSPRRLLHSVGRAWNSLLKVCNSFDDQHDLHQLSHKHSQPSLGKDEHLIIDQLKKSRVFDYVPGRTHHRLTSNPAEKIDISKLTAWLNQHKSTLQDEQNVCAMYQTKQKH